MTYLSLLCWLKWKLMFRRYRQSTAAVIGIIFMLLFLTPFCLGGAVATCFGYYYLGVPANVLLLRAVLGMIYLFWLLAPILGFELNESYDITKLFLYPLSPRQIYLGAMLGALFDMPVLLALPFFVAAVIGFAHGVLVVLLAIAVLIFFLLHTLAVSQALVLLSAGALRSRRWRDIMAVLGPLIALAFYLLFQLPRYAGSINWHAVLDNPLAGMLNYLPPGYAAQAVGAAMQGAWLSALGLLLLLGCVTVGTVYLAGHLVTLVTTGDVISAPARRPTADPPRQHAAVMRPLSLADRCLPPVLAAMAEKEWKYLFRDPLFKMTLMHSLYMFVVILFVGLRPRGGDTGLNFDAGRIWMVTALLLFTGTTLTFNAFGTEGSAVATLFLFPASRRLIIFGKNLVIFLANAAVNLAVLLLMCLFMHQLAIYPQLIFLALTANLAFVAVGNLISIWLPRRIIMRGWRMQQQSSGQGCGFALLYMAISFIGMPLIVLPLAVAVVVPTYWISPLWFALTLPLAAAYAGGLYLVSLYFSESLLRQQEVVIIERLAAEE